MSRVYLLDWQLPNDGAAICRNGVYPLVYVLGVFPTLTVRGNVLIGASLKGQRRTFPQIFSVTFSNRVFTGEPVPSCFKGFIAGFV
jgi:hypothetical protein